MSFLPASRTKRNLFKIASLGLAGLLAGLLAGCTDFAETSATSSYTRIASDSINSDASTEAQSAELPRSLDETQIPALRHPPSARRLQAGSVHTVSQTVPSTGGYGY
jgi:hypothetical protein